MKTKFFLYLLIVVSISGEALSDAADENSLLFEFKRQITCVAAKKELSRHKIIVECSHLDTEKKRYFGGRYLGNKSVNAIIFEVKKNTKIASVTRNKLANRIQ